MADEYADASNAVYEALADLPKADQKAILLSIAKQLGITL